MGKIQIKKVKREKPLTHEQWIEIRQVDGEFVSTFYPPNDEFERERQERDPQPVLIYRRLNFVHGVPAEYSWTAPPPDVRVLGGLFLQRMLIDDWLNVMEEERNAVPHHALPCANPQPPPPEFGGCNCDCCLAESKPHR